MRVITQQLQDILSNVKTTLLSKSVKDYCTYICFRDGKASTFNGSATVITKSPLQGLECLVPGSKFLKLVSDFPSDEMGVILKDNWLHIKAGTFKTKLPTRQVFDFPQIEAMRGAQKFCDAANLIEALKYAQISMFKDDKTKHGVAEGVAFQNNWVYSTDGKRITRAKLSTSVTHELSITSSAVAHLRQLGQPQYMFASGSYVGALYPPSMVYATLLTKSKFPFDQCAAVFDDPPKYEINITEQFLDVVNRVTIFSDNEESSISFVSDKGNLLVYTESEDGKSSDVVQIGETPDFKFSINANRLKSSLKALKPKTMDLTNVIDGDGRLVRFFSEEYQHAIATLS